MEKVITGSFKNALLNPIRATDIWIWHGYDNSDVDTGGQMIKSVSGGGHWGGGMWICTWDQARFGYLFLQQGNWFGKQLISAEWIDAALTTSKPEPAYGYMWWVNTDSEIWENYKDKIVYIKVDTIPSPTRKKYGILTTAEQEEQEVRKSEQLRAIYDDQIKKHIYKSKNIQHMRPCQRP